MAHQRARRIDTDQGERPQCLPITGCDDRQQVGVSVVVFSAVSLPPHPSEPAPLLRSGFVLRPASAREGVLAQRPLRPLRLKHDNHGSGRYLSEHSRWPWARYGGVRGVLILASLPLLYQASLTVTREVFPEAGEV